MIKEIPEFLLEMSKQMNEQDNRGTSDPIWQVRCKRLITCDPDMSDHWVLVYGGDSDEIFDSEIGEMDELLDCLIENEHEWVEVWERNHNGKLEDTFDPYNHAYLLPDGYDEFRKIYLQEIEEVVSTHLTKADAEWFIKRKQHDYPRLYTYVESAYWSPQLKELRNWIMSL